MKGYDFNGVVDTGRFIPEPTDVIITGNTVPMAKSVLVWLLEHNIYCPVYFNPYPHGANNMYVAGFWKAQMINKLLVSEFYEDDPLQFEIIKNYSPTCVLIKV